MKFSVLTLFPEMFAQTMGDSIIGRAQKAGLLDLEYVQIRDFAENKHNRVDDYPYGAGGGLVMQPGPVYRAYKSVAGEGEKKPLTVYLSPQGEIFRQDTAKAFAKEEHVVLLCGHYEGVDERVLEEIVDMEVSIGDFVLTGGEIPAMAVIDATARMIPGVLDGEETMEVESHYDGLLEYPQYTRPPEFMGRRVPEILLSGHHANIAAWRRTESLIRTAQKRPDLIRKAALTEKEREFLEKTLDFHF